MPLLENLISEIIIDIRVRNKYIKNDALKDDSGLIYSSDIYLVPPKSLIYGT